MIDTTEVSKPEGANIFVDSWVAGDNRKLCGRFGCFATRPNDIGCFNVGVREVVDTRKLFDVEYIATPSERALAIRDKAFFVKTTATCLEAVKVGRVKLLEGTHNCLHLLSRVHLAIA